ncbi:MAG: YraN family protein [Longimicrobiales bacterium]
MARSHELGRRGERLAEGLLRRSGWSVVDRNVRRGHREVDLVVRRGGVVAFVEVKTRSGPGFGHPLESITALKRREIESVARWWIARHGRVGEDYRFDAIAVVCEPGRGERLEHVEDAWRPLRR